MCSPFHEPFQVFPSPLVSSACCVAHLTAAYTFHHTNHRLPTPDLPSASKMSNYGTPEVQAIEEAYEAVRNDKDETSWLLVTAAKGNKLSLVKTGTDKCFVDDKDSTEEEQVDGQAVPKNAIVAVKNALSDDEIQYAYVRVEYANDSESTRTKFLLLTWMGPAAGMMRRARVTTESGDIQQKILRHFSKEVRTDDKKEIKHSEIVTALRKSGGADYNGGRG